MSDGIIQRRMNAEEEANFAQSAKNFDHTIQPDSLPVSGDRLVERGVRGEIPTGNEIRAQLLQRAAEQQHLNDTLGAGSQFFDYKNSSVGSIGRDREVHRQLTQLSRIDRQKREARFGHHKRGNQAHRKRDDKSAKRQAFNATGDIDTKNTTSTTRQGYNSLDGDSGRDLGISFREPTARGYDPFA